MPELLDPAAPLDARREALAMELAALVPPRFTLGAFLEAAESRSLRTSEAVACLRHLAATGHVQSDGHGFVRRYG